MSPQEAVAILRRTLGEFQGEPAGRLSQGVQMVARLTPTELTEAINALAAIEREVQS